MRIVIRSYETLRCYSCEEEEEQEQCSPMMNIIDGDDRTDACMVCIRMRDVLNGI